LAPSPRIEAPRRATSAGLILALGLALLPAPRVLADGKDAADRELLFSRHAEPVARRSLAWMREAVAPATVRVHEPYESGEVSFEALPLAPLLDVVYGAAWREEEELLFTCRDGYQPTVPVARVLAHHAWLAFARADQPAFTIEKRESGEVKTIDLAPFYLVWENLGDATVRQEADYGWPYQVVGIDLIRTRDRFPAMAPPADASPEVAAGFVAFRVHCAKCHRMNGEGGTLGPELNPPARAVPRRDAAWLRAWIVDPDRIRPGTRMPALNPALPDRAAVVDRIIAYLDAMARAKGAKTGP
jgi:mono/diheme cytochrome c family protein